MSSGFGMLLALGLGVAAGLRTMTAPALVVWAAHMGWINLAGSRFSFLGSVWAVAVFSSCALVEYVVDLMPSTPSRTDIGPLSARVVAGLFSGACLSVAAPGPAGVFALLSGLGAVIGAFGGYEARARLVRALRVPDAVIAIPEDLVAIGLGLLAVSRF